MIRYAVLLACAGCVAEYDVDVFVVLPAIPQPCETLGATQVTLRVAPSDEPAFAVTDGPCSDQVDAQSFAGFHVRLDRLAAGDHTIDAVIAGAEADASLGSISMPFTARVPVVISFERADLPNWPTTTVDAIVPGCAAGSPVLAIELTATPELGDAPVADVELDCTDPAPAETSIEVPVGPVTLSAIGVGYDGAPCWAGSVAAILPDEPTVSVPLMRSCP